MTRYFTEPKGYEWPYIFTVLGFKVTHFYDADGQPIWVLTRQRNGVTYHFPIGGQRERVLAEMMSFALKEGA